MSPFLTALVASVVILIAILPTDLGKRPITKRRILRSLIAVVVVCAVFVHSLPLDGNAPWLQLAGVGAGVVFGLIAAALLPVRRDASGEIYTEGGLAYVLVWIALSASRVLFAYGSDHWFSGALIRFSIRNKIIDQHAYANAFVFMALAVVLTRTSVLLERRRRLRLQVAAADGAVGRAETPAEDQATAVFAAPLPANAVRRHAVSKRVLSGVIAVGSLLAGLGGVVAFNLSPSAASVKKEARPILHPTVGTDNTPAPTDPADKHVGKPNHTAAPQGAKASSATQSATGRPGGHQTAQTPPTVQQSSYLSVRTSVDATNPWWSQSNVTVTTTTKLTALKVVVRIFQTGGVESTGTWTSFGSKATVHSAAGSQGEDYVVNLNPGVTVNPGTYVFEFQYNHAQGTRSTSRDLYAVVATAPGSAGTESKRGSF